MSGFHIKEKEFRINNESLLGMFTWIIPMGCPQLIKFTPTNRPVIGRSREEIGQLEYSDAMDFHQRYYTPDNAVIVISGNIDVDQAFLLTENRYFLPIRRVIHFVLR